MKINLSMNEQKFYEQILKYDFFAIFIRILGAFLYNVTFECLNK